MDNINLNENLLKSFAKIDNEKDNLINILEDDIAKLNSNIGCRDDEIRRLNEECKMLNKNYKNLLQSHEYIENECFELEIKNKELHESYKQMISELKICKKEHKEEIDTFTTKYQNLVKENDHLKKMKSDHKDKNIENYIINLKNNYEKTLQDEVNKYNKIINQKDQEYLDLSFKRYQLLDDIENMREEKRENCDSLCNELKRNEYKEKYNNLQKEYELKKEEIISYITNIENLIFKIM